MLFKEGKQSNQSASIPDDSTQAPDKTKSNSDQENTQQDDSQKVKSQENKQENSQMDVDEQQVNEVIKLNEPGDEVAQENQKTQLSQEQLQEEHKIELRPEDQDNISDFEITPESQIFDAFSSDNNSQEAINISLKIKDKQKRGEDLENKIFENGLFVVFDVSREPLGTVLILKSQDDDNVPINFRITLRGTWVRTPIDHGDIVRIIGQFKRQNNYTLTLDDNESDPESSAQYLILEPFILIPTTSIVSSFPCVRRSIFADQFRTNLGDYEYPLVIGNIIHEAFEKIILRQQFEEEFLEQAYKESLRNHICFLYKLKEPESKAYADLKKAARNIQNWVSNMLDPTEQEFNSFIFGIKGKIDATVVVKNSRDPDLEKITALELKTGKEQVYHKGQVLLYSLLLTERFINHNNSNLLLYLMSKAKTYYINTIRNELCILIQRRNELAKLQKINGEGKSYALPPILVDQDVCKNCYVNKVCSFYSMAIEEQPEKLPSFQAYLDVQQIADPQSLTYFRRWYEVIALEQSSVNMHQSMNLNDRKSVKDEGLRITEVDQKDQSNGEFIVKLERAYFNGARLNTEITENSFYKRGRKIQAHVPKNKKMKTMMILWEIMPRMRKGNTNMVNLDEEALGGINYKEVEWWIEIENFQTFQFNIMRHNLQNLCVSPENQKFRELIIQQRKPEFKPESDFDKFKEENMDILEGLNDEQIKAITKSYCALDYQMIIGVPASGKHEIVSRMLLVAKRLKKKILLMGMNNTTIDNVLLRLLELQEKYPHIEKAKFIRVCSNYSQINHNLKEYINPCTQFSSMEELQKFIDTTDIFCASTMSVFNMFFACIKFDYCILDEASLITEPLSIGPILMADKFVMIGDYYILNPYVKNHEAEKRGMSISLFRKLCEKHPYETVILKKQYRMCDNICSLINSIAYKGLIKHSSPGIQEGMLTFNPEFDILTNQLPWLKELKVPDRKVVFINTDNLLNKALQKQLNQMKNRNFYESAIIHAIVENFIGSGISRKNMAIITPFLDQQVLIQKQLQNFKVKVFNLDKIQGLQKEIIIISCVQHNRKQSILKDIKRLYLSFTHAKTKLIIVGSMSNVEKVKPMDMFLGYIRSKNWYLDLNNALQIKKHFAQEAQKYLSFLAPNKGDTLQGQRHPNTCAYLGNNKRFAEENKIVYHIDGVATTHTGMPRAKLNQVNLGNSSII
eukprot:403363527